MFSLDPLTCLMRFRVSPPPHTLTDPFFVAEVTAFNKLSDPFANGSSSNTPAGPFQNIVFDFPITDSKCSIVFSPISRPSHPSLYYFGLDIIQRKY